MAHRYRAKYPELLMHDPNAFDYMVTLSRPDGYLLANDCPTGAFDFFYEKIKEPQWEQLEFDYDSEGPA